MTKNHERPVSALNKVILAFLEYAFVFTVIIECNSLFHYSENYRQTSMEVVVTVFAILLAGILAVIFGRKNRDKLRQELKETWPVWSALLLCIFAFLVLNVLRSGAENALRKYTLSFILFLPVACLLFRSYRLDGKPHSLFFRYSDVMLVIAICNLIVFAAATFQPGIVQAQRLVSRWSNQGYFKDFINYLNVCCFWTSQNRTVGGITFYRSIAFFTEPVIYSIPLITALFTEMFLRQKEERRIWKWLVLLAAVLASQSTLGMLLAAGGVGIKLIEGVMPKRRWLMVFPALILVAAAVFLLLRQKEEVDVSSTATHIRHYITAFKTFLEHPLIGCGYFREDLILLHDASKTNKGLSNSVAVVLAEGGIFLGLMCMLPFFLGLAQIFSKNNKRVALWTLGPLGLYCVTVFHFHLLLMLFIAFGYSMLEIAPSGSKGKRRLKLADEEIPPEPQGTLTASSRAVRIIAVLLGCVMAAALFFSGTVWQKLSDWMELHQLYLGQSSWKAYYFSLFLILAVLVIRQAFRLWTKREEGRWAAETIWFLVYSALYAAVYPIAFSAASTALENVLPFGDFTETTALAGLYFGGIAVGWLLLALLRKSKKGFAAGLAAAVVLVGGVVFGSRWYLSRFTVPADEIAPVIREASAAAEGKIYANERQTAMKRALPELACAPARDGAFAALENASVVTVHERNLRDLLAAGFQVTELSPDYVLYSNDNAVIEKLQSEGYTFSKYYPFPMAVDNEAAIILKSGNCTLTAELRKEPETEAPHEVVGNLLITSYYGTKRVKKQAVYADDFDAEGCAMIKVAFNAGKWEGMEYRFVPEEGFELLSETLTLAETPKYLTDVTYDGRFLPIREAYFKPTGEPHYLSQGYAATSREYDRAGRLIRQNYYDEEGAPVVIKSGYASFTRAYNRQGRLWKEAYYDENGELCLLEKGYASYEKEFDRKGNVLVQRYIGVDGRRILLPGGYAEFRSVYNRDRQLLERRYYDENGESILLPNGYWMEKREYDEAGNVSVQRYYDTDGQSVITAMGYAEVRKEYNEKKKVVREEYYGVSGERIALPNGAASVQIEYGTNGKESARHYFDLNGTEFTPES
jgi:hypothetical protein